MLKHPLILVLSMVIAAFAVGGCAAPTHTAVGPTSLVDENGIPSLGHLRHRGKFYRLRDLTDPAFRARSNDAFIQNFDPDRAWAGVF